MAALYRLLRAKWVPPADPQTSFQGQTVLITGANTGLGFEAAIKFVALGASRVIIGVRNLDKGNSAKQQIESRANRSDVVEVWQLDMNSYDSVQTFAERTTQQLAQLDVVLLNAGLQNPKFKQTQNGWEETIQVNTLSTILLALALLPKLKSSKTAEHIPVLQFTSSSLHSSYSISEEHKADNILRSYNVPKGYRPGSQYGLSKLFMQLALLQIAQLVTSPSGTPDVYVTSVCPGLCKSDLARGYDSLFLRIGKWIFFGLVGRSTENGVRSLVSGTTLGQKGHGKIWRHDKVLESASQYDEKERDRLQAQLWFEIVDALRKDVPDVHELAKIS